MPIMIRSLSDAFARMAGMPINSKGGKNLLKQSGIDTNSKQYQAVMKRMNASAGAGVGYTNPEAIKNLMRSYDKDGDLINSAGIAGMDVTNLPAGSWHKIIKVSEKNRQEMFDNTKREFIQEYGIQNGDTTKRSEVFENYQRSVPKQNRLKGTWTLQQYESQYRTAMYDAVKKSNPNWKPGQSFDTSVLKNITRESVEATLKQTVGKYGETFVRNSVDLSI